MRSIGSDSASQRMAKRLITGLCILLITTSAWAAETVVGSVGSSATTPVPQNFDFLPQSSSSSGTVTALEAIDDAYAAEITVPAGMTRLTSAKIRIKKQNGRSATVSIMRGIGTNVNDTAVTRAGGSEIFALSAIQEIYEITPNIAVTPGEKIYVVVEIETLPNSPASFPQGLLCIGGTFPSFKRVLITPNSLSKAKKWSSGGPSLVAEATFDDGTVSSQFTLTATPTVETVYPGGSFNYNLSVSQTSGSPTTFSLSAVGELIGTTATFADNPIATSGGSAPSSTTVRINVPTTAPPGTYGITITASGSSGAGTGVRVIKRNAFIIPAAPAITQLNPNNGPAGTRVSIIGQNFGNDTIDTTISRAVTIGGRSAAIVSGSETTIVAAVPAGLSTGSAPVQVTIGSSASNTTAFAVTELRQSADAALAESAWPMLAHDARHTGFASLTAGPQSSGVTRWVFRTPHGGRFQSAPVIGADGTVYIGADDGYVYAVNGSTGQLIWEKALDGTVTTSTAAIAKDGTIVIGSSRGTLTALSSSGAVKWTFRAGGAIASSPSIGPDGSIFFSADDKFAYALNYDGSLRFKIKNSGPVSLSSPALEPLLDGQSALTAFTVHGTANSAVQNRFEHLSVLSDANNATLESGTGSIVHSPTLSNFGSGTTAVIGTSVSSLTSSGQIIGSGGSSFTFTPSLGQNFESIPAIDEGSRSVIVSSTSGTLFSLRPTGTSGFAHNWTSFPAVGATTQSPIVDKDGFIYIASSNGSSGKLTALTPGGATAWTATLDDLPAPNGAPAMNFDGIVYVPTASGKLVAIGERGVISRIIVSPEAVTLSPSETVVFRATALDQYGAAIDNVAFSWSGGGTGSLTPSATFSTLTYTAPATLSSTSESYNIIAQTNGVIGSAAVTVHRTIAGIKILPDNPSIRRGSAVTFSAYGTDSSGAIIGAVSASWSVTGGGILSATTGLTTQFTATTAGDFRVRASYNGVNTELSFTVSDGSTTAAGLRIEPDDVTIQLGEHVMLSAFSLNSAGQIIGPDTSTTWTVSGGGRLSQTAGATTLLTTIGPAGGPYTVTASSGSRTDTATFRISARGEGGSRRLTTVFIDPPRAAVAQGGSVALTAQPRDENQNVLSGIDLTWSVTGDGTVEVTGSTTARYVPNSVGTFEVRASATSGGSTVIGIATMDVTRRSGNSDISSISITPNPVLARAGDRVTLTATPKDPSGRALSGRSIIWASTGGTFATNSANSHIATFEAATDGQFTITASSEGITTQAAATIVSSGSASNAITRIEITPAVERLTVGGQASFQARAFNKDGNELPLPDGQWALSGGGQISSSGTVLATEPGLFTVSYSTLNSTTTIVGTAHLLITSNDPQSHTPITLFVTPQNALLPLGSSKQFGAAALDNHGVPGTADSPVWSVTGGGTITSDGLMTAITPGTYLIKAAADQAIGTTPVTIAGSVESGALTRLHITPQEGIVAPGQSQLFTVTGTDASNQAVTGLSPVWASQGVGSIQSNGVFQSSVTGEAQVTANVGGITAAVRFFVAEASSSGTPEALLITDDPGPLFAGTAHTFKVAGLTADQKSVAISPVWSVTGGGTIDPSTGVFNATTPGTYTITATVGDVSVSHPLVVLDPTAITSTQPVSTMVVSPAHSVITAGESVQFSTESRDTGGTILSKTATYTSNGGGTMTANGLFTAETAGTYTVTAAISGVQASTTITVNASTETSTTIQPQGTISTLRIGPDRVVAVPGESVAFSVAARDKFNFVVESPSVTWSVNGGGTITNNGTFTASTTGQFMVTAQSGTVIATALVTVSPLGFSGGIATLTLLPDTVSVIGGKTVTFIPIGRSASQRSISTTGTSWAASGGGTISTAGVFTGITAGTYSVTGTNQGISGVGTVKVVTDNSPPAISLTVNDAKIASGSFISQTPLVAALIQDDNGIDQPSIRMYINGKQLGQLDLSTQVIAVSEVKVSTQVREAQKLQPGTHSIRVEAQDVLGNVTSVELQNLKVITTQAEVVGAPINGPNPFSPAAGQDTTLTYTLNKDASVEVVLFDMSGRAIWRRHFAPATNGGRAGANSVLWNGFSDFDGLVPSGAYIYQIVSENRVIGRGTLAVLQ